MGFESKGLRLWVLSQIRARVSTRQSSDKELQSGKAGKGLSLKTRV